MKLHDITPAPDKVLGFYVEASNIHNDDRVVFGPFPGNPGFTYNYLRCDFGQAEETEGWGPPDDHIFAYNEGTTDPDGALAHWIDQEGRARDDGWRRCGVTRVDDRGYGQFGIEHGLFFTDLFIDMQMFPLDQKWESNDLP